MTAPPPVTIIVASQGRPDALSLCLTALAQQRYHPFEIVVVACKDGVLAARSHALAARMKLVEFSTPNLAMARNTGLSLASGKVVAFIDDDAIAEPFWLSHLIDPFRWHDVAAAGGFVTGRNGISLQWGGRYVNRHARHTAIDLNSDAPARIEPSPGQAVRTEGTNMAIRMDALRTLKGFDSRFAYFLDDTDLNMRLADLGHATAVVPRARVWHRQLGSAHRTANRTPRRLDQIGTSLSAFLDSHCPPAQREDALAFHRGDQRRRLLRHMVQGSLMPGDVGRLMADFEAGAETRPKGGPDWSATDPPEFRPIRPDPVTEEIRVHKGLGWKSLESSALDAVEIGPNWTFQFTPTALYHRVHYNAGGNWVQSGGLYGKSDRADPLFRFSRLSTRVARETAKGGLSRQSPP